MKKFYLSFSETGTLVTKFGQRCEVVEAIKTDKGGFTLTFTNGFNPRVHVKDAEDLAAAITAFDLKPYVAPAAPTIPECIAAAEKHISASFGPLIVSDGLKKIFERTAAGTLATCPKTIAVATWVETVKGMALAGSTDFPPAPATTQEVLSE